MHPELPEGITFNQQHYDDVEVNQIVDEVNVVSCPKCDIQFQSVLSTLNQRHDGWIQIVFSGAIVWHNHLPKDINKCKKILDENLKLKLDKHVERHNND